MSTTQRSSFLSTSAPSGGTLAGGGAATRGAGGPSPGFEVFVGDENPHLGPKHHFTLIGAVDINGFVSAACGRVRRKRRPNDTDPTRCRPGALLRVRRRDPGADTRQLCQRRAALCCGDGQRDGPQGPASPRRDRGRGRRADLERRVLAGPKPDRKRVFVVQYKAVLRRYCMPPNFGGTQSSCTTGHWTSASTARRCATFTTARRSRGASGTCRSCRSSRGPPWCWPWSTLRSAGGSEM